MCRELAKANITSLKRSFGCVCTINALIQSVVFNSNIVSGEIGKFQNKADPGGGYLSTTVHTVHAC